MFVCHFVIRLDHKPLRYLIKEDSATLMIASSCIQRWVVLLWGYEYTIKYKAGKCHVNAGFLSHLPLTILHRNSIPVPQEKL